MNTGKTGKTGKLLGRAFVYNTGDPSEVNFWEHELEPMEAGRMSGAEWARCHFAECMTDEDLRNLFGLPKEGSFQVLFSGNMRGGYSGFEYPEWDQEFSLDEDFKIAPIPAEYLKACGGKPT